MAGNLLIVMLLGVGAALVGIVLVYLDVFSNAARVLGISANVWTGTVGLMYAAFFRRNVEAFKAQVNRPSKGTGDSVTDTDPDKDKE